MLALKEAAPEAFLALKDIKEAHAMRPPFLMHPN